MAGGRSRLLRRAGRGVGLRLAQAESRCAADRSGRAADWCDSRPRLGLARAASERCERPDRTQLTDDDVFVFGRETSGLPTDVMAEFPPERRLRLPMLPGQRSLNLSNAVAVTVFEAWRQRDFEGGV